MRNQGGDSAKRGLCSASSSHCVIASNPWSSSPPLEARARVLVGHSALQAADRAQIFCQQQPRAHHYRVGCTRCNEDGWSHGDRPAPATVLRAAHSAWPATVRAQPGCPHLPRAHSCHMGSALRDADGESQCDSPAPAPMLLVSHRARWPWSAPTWRRTACCSAARAMLRLKPRAGGVCGPRGPAGESHCDRCAPAAVSRSGPPILWGEHSAC